MQTALANEHGRIKSYYPLTEESDTHKGYKSGVTETQIRLELLKMFHESVAFLS